jgi:signal transduction histidine kinase
LNLFFFLDSKEQVANLVETMKIPLISLLFCMLFSGFAYTQNQPNLFVESSNRGEAPLDITSQLDLSVQDVDKSDFENFEYKPNAKSDLKYPYTSKAIWMRFQFSNPHSIPVKKLLYLSSALTGDLELYNSKSHEVLGRSGSSVPMDQRIYPARLPAFNISLNPGESETFYLKRVSHHSLASKVYLGTPSALVTEEMDSKSILFFYLGGIICLILYNLFIGIYARDLNYFLYAFFAAAVASASLNTQGFFDAYIFTNMSFTVSDYLMVFSSVAILASVLFVYRFLNIRYVFREARIGFWVLGASGLITFIVGLIQIPNTQVVFGHMVDLTIVLLLFYLIACGVITLKRGYKLAQFFLLSWASLFVGVMGWFGMTYGFFPNTAVTSNALIFGNLGEMLILSLGLAYKIAILDQEKKQALIQAQDKEKYHRLVKVLSHDIANAIAIFSGYLYILKRNIQGERELKTIGKLENVLDNTKGMLGLVREEEVFNSFKASVTLRPVDLCEVIQEVVSFYEDRISEKELKMKIQIPEKSFVMADKTALANQVLSNLLSNAIKFCYPKSQISIHLESKANYLVLKIDDQGIGIPTENIQKVFFSKEITSQKGTMLEKGSGLGISLVKDYMEIFKGKIEVHSVHESVSKNSGTSISLFFPQI